MFAVPDLVSVQCKELLALRLLESPSLVGKPLCVFWEPHPKACSPSSLKEHKSLLHDGAITVFSPNHNELNAFFDPPGTKSAFNKAEIEDRAMQMMGLPKHAWKESWSDGEAVKVVIIRAAEHGCLLLRHDTPGPIWLPAFFGPDEQDLVIDPTGAGNAFIGGLAEGYLQTGDWIMAACYGSVAASIVLQYIGPPALGYVDDDHTIETWTGVKAGERLEEYLSRPEVQSLLS